jgi:hypothetical protein
MESIIDSKNHNVKSNQSQKLVLISSFCDNEEKKQVLYKNLLELKKIGVDTLVISPNFIQLPSYIIELCDYFFYTKENPLLSPPVRGYYHWKEYKHPIKQLDQILHLKETHNDYGWAALWQTKKLLQIGLTLDYDNFYHLVYDTKVDEVVKEGILGNKTNIVYRLENRYTGDIWDTTLLFFILDREIAAKVEKEITLEEYLSTNGVAEGEVQKWMKKFNLKNSEKTVQDMIFFFEDYDFFNHSPYPEFKMYLSKHGLKGEKIVNAGYEAIEGHMDASNLIPLTDNLRIAFYNIKEPTLVFIIINGVKYQVTPLENEFIEFPISSHDINSIKFEFKGKKIDFTEDYSNIIENEIYYRADQRKPITNV